MKLSDKNLKTAVEIAEASFAKWNRMGKQGSGTYNHNKIDGCLIGSKCEVGVHQFLMENGIFTYAKFLDLEAVDDLVTKDVTIESKGLRNADWERFKRCVPPRQLEKYVKKEAIVVWATTTVDPEDPNVYVKGWNFAKEIKDKGVFRRTICDNIWLKEDRDMRLMPELIKHLNGLEA